MYPSIYRMKKRLLISLFAGAFIFSSVIILRVNSAQSRSMPRLAEDPVSVSPTIAVSPSYQPTDIPTPINNPSLTPTPTPTFTPTPVPRIGDALPVTNVGVDVSADPSRYEGSCKDKLEFTFTATVTLEKSGTVIYKWLRSDGAETSSQTLSFSEAGTKTVTVNWQPDFKDLEFSGWQKMKISSPVETESNQASFTVLCSL